MTPDKFLARLFLTLILASSLVVSGCSYIPWVGNDDEDDLAFEEDFPFEDEKTSDSIERAAGGKTTEDDFFADDPVEDVAETVTSLTAEKSALQGDVEGLQVQQEALVSKVRELEETINTLEPRLEAAQENLDGGVAGSEKLDYLEPEVEELKAQVVELKAEIAAIRATRTASTQKKAAVAPKTTKSRATGTPADYDNALAAYRSKSYDESILLFQNLALSNPPTSLQDNILFWIGSNYVQLEMYDDAIENFQSVLNKYPRGNKTHDSRYMMGVSYSKKGETSRAIEVLQSALRKNPPAEVRGKIMSQLKEIQ